MEQGWARSVIILLGLEVRGWMPVIVFFVRPSSTSAHSAGVGREGGLCSLMCSLCMSVRPLAQTADPGEKSGQANYTLGVSTVAQIKVGVLNVADPVASRSDDLNTNIITIAALNTKIIK